MSMRQLCVLENGNWGNRAISLNLGCKMNAERVTCVNLASMSGGIEKVAYFVFGRNVDRNLKNLIFSRGL